MGLDANFQGTGKSVPMKHPVNKNQPQQRYVMAAAVAIVLTATFLRLAFLQNMEMRNAFITFYPAVMLAALYGGLRAGAVATILSGLIADYFWMEPAGSFIMAKPIEWLALAIFVASGFLMSWAAEKFHQSNNRLRQAEAAQRVELERLVAERTAALTNELALRNEAEASLKLATAESLAIFEHAAIGIAVAQAVANGKFLRVNDGLCKMLGYAREELLGLTFNDITHPDDMQANLENVRAILTGEIATYRMEKRYLHRDGHPLWINISIALMRDQDGRPNCFIGSMVDITERKRAEEALRKSEHRLRRVYELGLMGFVTWKMNGDIVDANDKFLEMVGYERADLAAGRINWKQMTPPEFTSLGSFVELKATAASSVPFEKEYFRKDGSRVPVLATRALFDEMRGDGVAMIIDITERKKAEQALALAKTEAERANVAKSKFLAAASHDLRQPVQSLTLLLSAIKGQVKDRPRTASAVEMAKSAVDSLNGLLTGILDISKLGAGVVTPILGDVDLGELVDRLTKEYGSRAAAEGLTLRYVSSAIWVRTDAALVERIARNLIENALRYTEKGGILIGLRKRGGNVRLDVIDTGIGIPADKQAEIFEEFRQLNNPARDASHGLGLGLSIVSRLAQLLGAPVEVASRLSHGTRFSLLLPLIRAAAADTQPDFSH